MPEAYSLVQQYEAVRPGFLLLDSEGRKWGSIALSPAAPGESLRRVKRYLRDASDSKTPLADARDAPRLDLEGLAGHFEVKHVPPDSRAAALGLEPGDRILAIDGRTIAKYGDALAALAEIPGDALIPLDVERAGKTLRLRVPCELPDVGIVFIGRLSDGTTLELVVK